MHQISNVRVQNYRSIKDGKFPLSPYTPLVGYNNAGKTNVLQAVSWFIKKRSLTSSDFHDPEQPLVVTATISGITAEVLDALGGNHRTKIEPIIVDGSLDLRRTQLGPDDKASEIRLEVRKTNEAGELVWEVNPAGIDAAISQLFPEPIFIGAMENATEDVGKFAAGTTIGKLIKEIIEPVTAAHAGPVSAALADIATKLTADSPEKDENLVALDMQIQTELAKIFPGVSAKIHIPTPEFSDFLKGATIKIFEDNFHNPDGRDAASFGHGAQRSVQIALIKCLSRIKRAGAVGAGRTTLLLIDEPELYLHPQAVELVRASLSSLSSDGYQVLFSTHSPNMIARQDAHNALLIRRNAAVGTRAYPRIRDAVVEAIAEAAHQSETLFALTNSAKVLFSEYVVLAEGKTEKAILPDLFQHEIGATMDEERLGLVALGGSSNVCNAMKVLAAMGIPTKAIVDLDFAFKVAPGSGLIENDHASLVACKAILERLSAANQITIDAEGLPTNGNEVTAAGAYELMVAEPDAGAHVSAIHAHLLENGIWCWTKGTIESHLGLPGKTPAVHMAFLRDLSGQAFKDDLPDYAGAAQLMSWLREH